MQWIIRFFVSHRNISSLAVTVIASFLMLSGNPVQQQKIARALMFSVFYPFQFYFNQTTRIKNVVAENRTLKETFATLSARVAQLSEAGRENERLTEMLGIARQFPYQLVPGRVVVRDPSFVSRSAIINVGRDQGLLPFMPVMTIHGAAGKIIQVMQHMSLVQLILDPSNRTSVMVQRSREIGILETENGNDFFIMFRAHADVNVGDTIITSGLGGIYPKGLLAGRVAKLTENRDPIFKKALITPEVDFDRIEEVFVLKLSPQWAAFKQELDSLVTSSGKQAGQQ
jgi:rod shape-determining protein MreC